MSTNTTITIQAVVLLITAGIGVFTYLNTRRKDIKQEEDSKKDDYFTLSRDIAKIGVKIDALGGDFREIKSDVKSINDQLKDVNERTIRQDGRLAQQEERIKQLERRVDIIEKGAKNK